MSTELTLVSQVVVVAQCTAFSVTKTLVKTLAKNLISNLIKNRTKKNMCQTIDEKSQENSPNKLFIVQVV